MRGAIIAVCTNAHILLSAHSPRRSLQRSSRARSQERQQLWQLKFRLRRPAENVNGQPHRAGPPATTLLLIPGLGLISTTDDQGGWRKPLDVNEYGFAVAILEGPFSSPRSRPDLMMRGWKSGKENGECRGRCHPGYSTPTIWRPKSGPTQILIPESFQLTSYSIADGKKLWWVRGLACEMKSVASIDEDTLYVNGWGFGANQAGTQVPTVDFAEALKRIDANRDGFAATKSPSQDRAKDGCAADSASACDGIVMEIDAKMGVFRR